MPYIYQRHWTGNFLKIVKELSLYSNDFTEFYKSFQEKRKNKTPILHSLSQKRELEGTQFMKTALDWNPTQTKVGSENQAKMPHSAPNKILGIQTQQRIKGLTLYDRVNVTAGMQGRFNMRKINGHKWPYKLENTPCHRWMQEKSLPNFNVSIREGRVPGLGPRPLTPLLWLQVAWERLRQDVGETGAFWLPKASV